MMEKRKNLAARLAFLWTQGQKHFRKKCYKTSINIQEIRVTTRSPHDVALTVLAKRQHEIDFIVNSASRKIYIQSAFRLPNEEKTRQEVLPLCNTGDNFRKIVVTYGMRQPNEDNNGILYAGLIPFLLDEKVIFG